MGKVEILSASAGSGKTHRLALNYIKTLLDEPYNYRHILAVTFTNKATDELKERILRELNALASGTKSGFDADLRAQNYDPEVVRVKATKARNLILHDYNNFAVMTIDKFFQRVLRAFIKELGIDLNFNLELKTESLLEQATDRMLEQITENKTLYGWIIDYIEENISVNKSWSIRDGIFNLGKALFNEDYKHASIDTKCKAELKDIVKEVNANLESAISRLRQEGQKFVDLMNENGITADDFKSKSSGVGTFAQLVAEGTIKPNLPKSISNALDKGEWHNATGKNAAYKTIDSLEGEFHRILSSIMRCYNDVTTKSNTRNIISGRYRDFALLADLRSCLDAICAEEDILPISDVSEIITKLVADNDAPFIYEKAGNHFDYFMIDEFQDTSTVQWRNFVPLLHNALAQSAGSPVLLVGDVKQSIYRWRGGDWSLLAKGVHKEFDEVSTENLEINRRSTRNVVEFNNGLTEAAVVSIESQLKEILEKAQERGDLTAELTHELSNTVARAYDNYIQKKKDDATDGYVTVLAYDKNTSPHPAIKRIEELQERGLQARDIAILARTNEEASKIASQILTYKNDPNRDQRYIFDVITQDALQVGSSKTVQFIIACLTISTNPSDLIALAHYNEYLERPISEPLSEQEADFLNTISLMQPEEAFNELLLHFPMLATVGETPYLQALHSLIIRFCSKNIADTALFLKWWNEPNDKAGRKESLDLPKGTNAITIITIHKSKGLGFKAVIIPYCNWSLKPKSNSTMWAEPNEPLSERIKKFPTSPQEDMGKSIFSHSYYKEYTMSAIDALNALYVGITRATDELHIMVPEGKASSTVGDIVKGFAKVSNNGDFYALGEPVEYKPEEYKPLSLSTFRTFSPSQKVAVRYSHQRYDEESNGENLNPRSHGILMHRAMEQATSMEDVARQIDTSVESGLITPEEATDLKEKITEAVNKCGVSEWFDGSWESVKNECEIIDNGKSRRPDRVMIRGDEAVVVDYKFGSLRTETHSRQIEAYASMLRRMGYDSVKGYLWYITLGEVDQVV